MKFDDNLTSVLKNFSTINPSLVFKPGSVLTTMAPSKTIIAKAKLPTDIEDTFAIYDLARFLGTLSLFDDPEIAVLNDHMEIRKGNRKIGYYFSEPSFIVQPPEKEMMTLNPDIQFKITDAQLMELLKALSILTLENIAVVGDGTKISICAMDSKISDQYSIDVGETDKTFKMVFKAENLKMMMGSYEVVVDKRGLSKWYNDKVEYFITVESDKSSFDD